MRGGDTGTRQRNEFSKNNNPLLKSMPNFDFFRDQKSPIPFEENSLIQHTSVNLEVNSSFSQTTSVNNMIPFSSPDNRGNKRVASSPSPSRISRKFNHLFEEFFIIGVDKDELTKLDWRKTDTHRVSPETQYLHIADKKDDCDRRRVVKDFCFPDGIEVKKLNKSSSLNQA